MINMRARRLASAISLVVLAACAVPAAAFAGAPGGAGGPGLLMQIAPLIAIFVIFYFLLIRPQQKRAKEHREMVGNLRRGDVVVTGGGFIGKVKRVTDLEASVEIADDVTVRVIKATIQEVRAKTEPAPANDPEPDEPADKDPD